LSFYGVVYYLNIFVEFVTTMEGSDGAGGPPHGRLVSDKLQNFVLLPCLLLFIAAIGYLIYRLLQRQKAKQSKSDKKAKKKRDS
jgi:hypothetical protein